MSKPLAVMMIALGAIVATPSALASNIQPNSYAWSENAGWINFATAPGDITVSNTGLSGFAWAENLGWINFNPASGGVTNNGAGMLAGFAWSENAGWINFAPNGVSVTINTMTGVFSGFAWGENIGWINFSVPSPVTTTWGAATSPVVQGTASRKAHAGAGTFNLPLAP
jgi:hypothetical protein